MEAVNLVVVDGNDDHKDEAEGFLPVPNSGEEASKDSTFPAQHTRDFAAASAISSAEEAIVTGSFSGCHSVLDGNDDHKDEADGFLPVPNSDEDAFKDSTFLVQNTTDFAVASDISSAEEAFFTDSNNGCHSVVIDGNDDPKLLNMNPTPPTSSNNHMNPVQLQDSVTEIGESSSCSASDPTSVCEICYEIKDAGPCFCDRYNDRKEAAGVESSCPECMSTFCAQCKSPWHGGMSCEQFQKLVSDEMLGCDDKNDVLLMEIAKEESWMRCPGCKIYIEKNRGCNFMICWWCKIEFCYYCGSTIVVT